MRTTLTVNDVLMPYLQEITHRRSIPFKVAVNEVLAKGLGLDQPSSWVCKTHKMGTPIVNLKNPWDTVDSLEALAVAEKLELRK